MKVEVCSSSPAINAFANVEWDYSSYITNSAEFYQE